MIVPAALTPEEIRTYFRDLVSNDAPKCVSCKWMRPIVREDETRDRIPGKGACREPSLTTGSPQLFYVTDLMLCSMWEPQG